MPRISTEAAAPTVPAASRRSRALGVALPVLGGVLILGAFLEGATYDIPIGTPLPPLLGPWAPDIGPVAALAAALLALAVAFGPRLLDQPRSPYAVAGILAGATLVLGLAVAASREGTIGWYGTFDPSWSFEAKNEYLPGLGAAAYGLHFLLDRWAELVPALPVHTAGHPPGLLITIDTLGITTPQAFAALCIAGAVAVPPLTYVTGRGLLSEREARMAGLLAMVSPALLVLGVASADAIYAALGLLAAIGLLGQRPASRVAGAAMLALASFFTWAILAVGAWAGVVRWRREGFTAFLVTGFLSVGAVIVFYAVLHLLSGFDPIGTIQRTEEVYRAGIAAIRPYEYWFIGSPAAWLLVLGLATAFFFLRALAVGDGAALGVLAIVAIAVVLGLTKAETERIWLFLVPLACLAAASVLPERWLRLVLGLLAAQALAAELLLYNVW